MRGRRYTFPADIWSLGCAIMFVCNTGRDGPEDGWVEGIPESKYSGSYSNKLATLIKTMLHDDHHQRPTALTVQASSQKISIPVQTKIKFPVKIKQPKLLLQPNQPKEKNVPIQQNQQFPPIRPNQPMQLMQPMKLMAKQPMKPDQQLQPIQHNQQIQQIQPIKKIQPIKIIKPIKKIQPIEKTQPIKKNQPIQQMKQKQRAYDECWKCYVKFIKEEGCNKMTCSTPDCGTIMCYSCKQLGVKEAHFYLGWENTCPLWRDNRDDFNWP